MYRLVILFSGLLLSAGLSAADGLVRLQSNFTVSETLDRYEAAVRAKGMTVFTRVNHTAGAAGVDLPLAANEVLIFGNPKIGTLLMQSRATAGIDLPMKALAYADDEGQVWLVYNDPGYLVDRHRIVDRAALVAKMKKALAAFAQKATQ